MDESAVKNKQKAECYRLLAACYCLPGKEFNEEGLADNLAGALEPVCPEAVPYAKEMLEALASCDLSYVKNKILIDYWPYFWARSSSLPRHTVRYTLKRNRV